MEANELLTIGNVTTIVVWVGSLIAPYVASYGISKDVVVSLLFALLWLGFTVYSSANPNTFEFLGNQLKEKAFHINNEETVLNDEYVSDIVDDEGC